MAAPATVSPANLTGTYTLNSKLSDSMDPVLKMQGVGWLVRQAASYSTITVKMAQYARAEDGVVCLDVDQVSTGGIRSTEERVLNWEWFEKNDRIWGKVRGRARLVFFFSFFFFFPDSSLWKCDIFVDFWRTFRLTVIFYSRIIKLSELDADDYLKSGWAQDCVEGDVIEMQVDSITDTWTAQQVWGMAEVKGERRQVRKVLAKKGDKVHRISIVYDYVSK